jgi:hypothetical protein
MTTTRSGGAHVLAVEATRLISRYPALTTAELGRLIDIYPRLPILDVGLMTSDPSISTRLDAFCKDHGRKLKRSMTPLLFFLIIPIAAMIWALLLV